MSEAGHRRAAKVAAVAFLFVFSYVLIAAVLGRIAAAPPLLFVVLAGLVAVVWSAIFAATLESVAPTGSRLRALLRPRSLVVLTAFAFATTTVLMYEARGPSGAELFAGPLYEPAPYVMFHARPNYAFERANDVMVHGRAPGRVSINSGGFRGPEWPGPEKATGELRVAVLGGSLVFNGVSDDRTIPALLARDLGARLGNARVIPINAGIVGANSTQELVLLQTRVIDLAPDLVVVLDGFNDVLIPVVYEDRPGYPFNFGVTEAAWRALPGPWSPLDWLGSRSRTLERLRSLVRTTATTSPDIDRIVAMASQVHETNWRKMGQVCEANEVDCVFALQPTLLYRRTPVGAEQDISRLPALERAVTLFYRQAETRVAATRAAGMTAVSLAALFENYPDEAYWDVVHVFDEGNELIATRLTDVLCQSARLRGRCR